MADDTVDTLTLATAKAQLDKLVQQALAGQPPRITHGRESVVVLSGTHYIGGVPPRRNLVGLFSALRGSGVDLERDRDLRREAP